MHSCFLHASHVSNMSHVCHVSHASHVSHVSCCMSLISLMCLMSHVSHASLCLMSLLTAASLKRKSEGGINSGMIRKATCLAMRQDDRHSHAFIVPECGMFCTPQVVPSRTKTTIRFRHLCRVAQKQMYGLSEHLCRKCHRTAAQCTAAVCTYIACSRPQKFCEHLHAQEGAMKTSATEADISRV